MRKGGDDIMTVLLWFRFLTSVGKVVVNAHTHCTQTIQDNTRLYRSEEIKEVEGT